MSELFNLYWRRIIPLGQTSSIAFPFSRLHNEPFWELLPLPGNEIMPATVNNISSVSQLRTVTLSARLDEELFHAMQQPESRNALREALLRSWLTVSPHPVIFRHIRPLVGATKISAAEKKADGEGAGTILKAGRQP